METLLGREGHLRENKADHVIVGIHWGVAFINKLPEFQQPLARKMAETGVSLIDGKHPHIRHHIERQKKGIVVYSLGLCFTWYSR